MVQFELKKMLAVSADDMNEQELDQLYDEITMVESDQLNFDLDQLQSENMFKMFKRILLYKGEQVDSLMTEIEELATKQGEEEARIIKDGGMNIVSASNQSQNKQTEFIQKELNKLEMENQRLMADVQMHKTEIDCKVKEIDKLSAQLSKTEREKDSLRRELDAVQDDFINRPSDDQMTEGHLTMAERFRDLTELVRQKNQHITQLLNDIEVSEKENKMIKQMLASTRDELRNATVHINTLSSEYGNIKCLQDEYIDRILTLELNDKGLRSQIAELVAEKEKCEEQIEELGDKLESRIKQLTELLSKKDEENVNLKSRLGPSGTLESHNEYLAKLQETVARQEDQLAEFQKQIRQATNDLNRSSAALEHQKKLYNELLNKSNETPEVIDLRQRLHETKKQLELTTDKAKIAEEDATRKAEQISKLIIQVRDFESGVFGLEEALEENRKLKRDLEIRDNQIEELIDSSNRLHQEADLLEQDNLAMREKLGLSVDEVVRPKGMIARHKEAQTKMAMLQKELDECKETIVNLKLKNRSLNKSTESVRNIPPDGEGVQTQNEIYKHESDLGSELEDNVKELIDENESLRKGMHEILDSVHNQDGASFIRIECESLERLLQAMDARHVAGWYQPGMRLLARIHHLDGVNSNLRHQLHSLHDALTETQKELQSVQNSLPTAKTIEDSKENDITDTNNLNKLQKEQEKSAQLEDEVKLFQNKFQQLRDEMKTLNYEYDVEKDKMRSVVEKLELELHKARDEEKSLKERYFELEKSWKALIDEPDQIKRQLSYNVIRVAALTEELHVTKRMYECCLDSEQIQKKDKQKAFEDMCAIKTAYSKEIELLLKIQEEKNSEVNKMNEQMNNSVHIHMYQSLQQELEILTIKHRKTLHLALFKEDTYKLLTERLMAEVVFLKDQRQNGVITASKLNGLDNDLAMLKAENVSCVQRAEHAEKMYSLIKDQMGEMEARCKSLEQNLCDMIDANLKCQTEEVRLRETTVNMVEESEYDKIAEQYKTALNNLNQSIEERNRLLRILDITQSQVQDLEHHHKRLDHNHDVMQRRIIELQALSEEKSTIDRLMREIASHEDKQIASAIEENRLKALVQDQQTIIANLECKNDDILEKYNSITERYKTKIMRLEKIVVDLQNRYCGAVPLVSEQIWVTHKQKLEEALMITYRKWLDDDDKEKTIADDIVFVPIQTSDDYRLEFTQLQLKELNVQMTCDDLRKKMQLCTERIEKQDCFIKSLEKEILRMDTKYMHNFLLWGSKDHEFMDATERPKKLDKQISAQTENDFETLENKIEDLSRQLITANNTIRAEKERSNLAIEKLQASMNDLEICKNLLENELVEKDDHIRRLNIALASNEPSDNNTQNPALLATIESLETIISQKEETINRLQELLKECREEHAKEITELQKKTESLNLNTKKSQEDVVSPIRSTNIRPVVNQYMLKIADLEDRLKQAEDELNQANSEKEHWSGVAERRLKEMEQMKTEDESKEKDAEITRLNEIIMGLQAKRDTLPAQRDRLRMEVDKMKKKQEDSERREKEDKAEIQKLRQQIIYRPPASGKRDETMTVVKEEVLCKKIKTLESELDEYKKREEQNKLLKKMKSDELVGKWEMNKRRQATIEKLQTQLLEVTRECESLRSYNQRLRENLARMEKDRNGLELKLKSANSAVQSSALANSLIEELTLEKDRLANELYTLRSAKELTSGGTSLAEVVVELRRKISALELLQKGGSSALIKEIENLKDKKCRLEKTKSALEEENIRLKKTVDRLQSADNMSGVSSLSSESDLGNDRKRTAKLERLVIMLRTAVDKLKEENKNLSLERVVTNIDDKSYVEKLQKELQSIQSYYLDSSEKCSHLEQQLCDFRSQYQAVLAENENLKNQLEKKCYLLSKTKTMLEKAAAREQLIMEPDRQKPISSTHFID
ncbi:centrosomal protein of 290 kDa isoform X2 [Adelges cooleyi]|uniref:centrosomal protein of 290 kDa isoform X2 n=1 Tax=Adelges cooleyi TaxID=133065 RepID=UPI0021803101|nr:centrosomal protein of 290 kDa isoform X2 [Adelges cooleyi]